MELVLAIMLIKPWRTHHASAVSARFTQSARTTDARARYRLKDELLLRTLGAAQTAARLDGRVDSTSVAARSLRRRVARRFCCC